LDLYYTWYKHSEIEEGGALLVRPDGVVAWRNKHAASDSQGAERQLRTVLGSLLDRPQFA
jgi:2,4-dichlorophenol 6-monooxygenase